MHTYRLALLLLGLSTLAVGVLSIGWCRCGGGRAALRRWGGRMFLAALVILGAISLAAAWEPHRQISYLGLAVPALVVGMLWEGPNEQNSQRYRPEEA